MKHDSAIWLDYRAFMKCIFQKSYRESIEDFRKAERRTPGANVMDHEYAFYVGLCYIQLCKYDSAEQCFRKCIATDELNGANWVHYMHTFYLGVTLYLEDKYTLAVEQFDCAIATYPNFSDAEYYKALCLKLTDQIPLALQTMTQAARDINDGFTINEDNASYERYPYQIKKSWVEGGLATLQKANENQPATSQ